MNRRDLMSGAHFGHSLHPVNYVSFGMDLKTLCCGKNQCFEAGTKESVRFALLRPTEKHLNERNLSFFSLLPYCMCKTVCRQEGVNSIK